ncbi:MAG: carboxypeptidase regulatory-like domain-containing protein [Pseudonocardiaceae bacterium]
MRSAGPDLTLRGVTFAYGPHAEPVLRDLNLIVPAGDHLAIVGPSGIGKSTLAGLLCGLLRPDSGTVELDGAIAAELPPDQLAQLRTLIPQEAYVFAGTLWDNLTYLCSTATARQVDNAVSALGAEALITKLGGVSAEFAPEELSAGQRQLIALVRSYISAAPVVVLDEATCHLDPSAERLVEEAFADRDGTLIVIAHRVSSALRARRTLVLDGVSAVAGDHLTLLSTSPLYRELLGHWQVGSAVSEADAVTSAGPVVRPAWVSNGATPAFATNGWEPARESAVLASVLRRRLVGDDRPSVGAHRAVQSTGTGTVLELPPSFAAVGPAAAGHRDQLLIFGQVRSGQTPLAAATLTLTDPSGRQLDRDCADSVGHYRLTPPTSGSYLVICAAKGHQPTATLVAVTDTAVRHDVVLSGGGGAGLTGIVSTVNTGQAVGNAVVTLVDGQGDVVATDTTGSDGRFAFLQLPQGQYTLTVAAESRRPTARSVEVPLDGQVSCDVEVVARVQLAGTVCTATTGAPVLEALASVVAADGRVVASVITGRDGRFVFDNLDAGVYKVIATGYAPVTTEVDLGAGESTETVISLMPPRPGSNGDGS